MRDNTVCLQSGHKRCESQNSSKRGGWGIIKTYIHQCLQCMMYRRCQTQKQNSFTTTHLWHIGVGKFYSCAKTYDKYTCVYIFLFDYTFTLLSFSSGTSSITFWRLRKSLNIADTSPCLCCWWHAARLQERRCKNYVHSLVQTTIILPIAPMGELAWDTPSRTWPKASRKYTNETLQVTLPWGCFVIFTLKLGVGVSWICAHGFISAPILAQKI